MAQMRCGSSVEVAVVQGVQYIGEPDVILTHMLSHCIQFSSIVVLPVNPL